ncbi:zf-HC2 domain-containing protein [bacterium]|nr:zf-HC2 domain-containing protein [bacterium]
MDKNLTCSQVCALINFYIEGNLTPKLKQGIENHIKNCPSCRKKIEDLSNLLSPYSKNRIETAEEEKDYVNQEFVKNLSAYIDNELNPNENVKIKKIAISNPAARKKLDSMYKYRQLLQSSYSKTRNESKFDYSRQIISQIQDAQTYSTTCFHKIAIAFIFLISAIILGFIYLYF